MSSNKYGYSDKEWEDGKREIVSILRERASRKDTIPYSELSSKLTTIRIDHHSDAMPAILGQISTQEDSEGRGMLSVIVVRKHGEQKPGKGFYNCALSLGKEVSDEDEFWISELQKVFETWAKRSK